MGCTGNNNEDEYDGSNQRRVRQRHNYPEDEEELEEEESITDVKEFKDFEELGSKHIK